MEFRYTNPIAQGISQPVPIAVNKTHVAKSYATHQKYRELSFLCGMKTQGFFLMTCLLQ